MRPRILYICHRVPFPPDKGDRIRNYNLLLKLTGLGDVDLLALADEPASLESRAHLSEITNRFALPKLSWFRWFYALASVLRLRGVTEGAFFSRQALAQLGEWTKDTNYDLAIASSSGVARYLQSPSNNSKLNVVDLIDIDSQKWSDYADHAKGLRKIIYCNEAKSIAKIEKEICAWADKVLLVSPDEAAVLQKMYPKAPIVALTNGVDLEYFKPLTSKKADTESGQAPTLSEQDGKVFEMVFLGAMDYEANIDGITWFVRDVWPALLSKNKGFKLTIVGRNPSDAIRKLGLDNEMISVTGSVDDVRPYLAAADVVITPLRIARGIQNKVLEGMAMAKASIVSPAANQGLRTIAGKHLLVAETSEEWVRALRLLADNPSQRSELASAGRNYVETAHSWTSCLEPIERFLSERHSGGPV